MESVAYPLRIALSGREALRRSFSGSAVDAFADACSRLQPRAARMWTAR
jgi:hypothetical protein